MMVNPVEIVKGRPLVPGQIIHVYKNLNRDCFSLRDKQSGLVVAYADNVTLANVKFYVSQAGRERVIERKVRSVHGWVIGEFVSANTNRPDVIDAIGYYNPYQTSNFINESSKEIIYSSPLAYCSSGRVFYQSEILNLLF